MNVSVRPPILETDRSASSRTRNRQDDDADGRVGVLLERGVTPERILLLTFTRRSAREIVSRVRTLRGADQGRRVSGGPFTPSPTTRFVATTLPWVYLKDSVCWTAATPLT